MQDRQRYRGAFLLKFSKQLTEWPNIGCIDGDETGGVEGEQGIVQATDLPAVPQQALGRHT